MDAMLYRRWNRIRQRGAPPEWVGLRLFLAAALGALVLAVGAPPASAQVDVLFETDFESPTILDDWSLSGDWRFRENSPCLSGEVGFISEITALVFDSLIRPSHLRT